MNPSFDTLLQLALGAALAAGRAILEIYNGDASAWEVERKADSSPLTLADRTAHAIIAQRLAEATPEVPLLSEEGAHTDFSLRRAWHRMWIVDPLDGTKEFLKRNGEFTVNIGLVVEGVPVLGVVFAPARGVVYAGFRDVQANRAEAWKSAVGADGALEGAKIALDAGRISPDGIHGTPDAACANVAEASACPPCRKVRVVASKSHLNERTQAFIDTLRERHGEVEVVSAGSSLKICLVAEGAADVYPRLAPTMEWDTAAADAVLTAAGGRMLDFSDASHPLMVYNKPDLHNPEFVALGKDFVL